MEKMLSVKNLKTYYYSGDKVIPAVDGVDFELGTSECLGIIGESGCGKSTVARSIVGLLDKSYTRIVDGVIRYNDKNLIEASKKEMCQIRGRHISMIFQNPFVSLNPFFTIENQIWEILHRHYNMSKKEARPRIIELLKLVGIPSPELRISDYPHHLSGGMQQRVMIAIAISCNPNLLIADEPTTALDVTVQAQILELISKIKDEFGMSIIFITHNLGIVSEICEKVMVMYGGVAVEQGSCSDIFSNPKHPYTQGLLSAIPSINDDKEELFTIKGSVPRFTLPIGHCRFADRCSSCFESCLQGEPPLFEAEDGRRFVRCWLYQNK